MGAVTWPVVVLAGELGLVVVIIMFCWAAVRAPYRHRDG